MIIIMKERGDTNKKMGILQLHDDDLVEIIKHPTLPEGQKYHKSTMNHLITSVKTQYERKENG